MESYLREVTAIQYMREYKDPSQEMILGSSPGEDAGIPSWRRYWDPVKERILGSWTGEDNGIKPKRGL